MNHTPEISFENGMLRALEDSDISRLLELYQQQVMPGQKALIEEEQAKRMITLAAQMASQQRGMMWALTVDGQLQGVLSFYDWRPSLLKTQIRLDVFNEVGLDVQKSAVKKCIEATSKKYHLRNFIYQWVDGQPEKNKQLMLEVGFEFNAKLRDLWRTGQDSYVDVEQYNLFLVESEQELN